jgi:HD-like signal output (HDOD) protein
MKRVLFLDSDREALIALREMLSTESILWNMFFAISAKQAFDFLEKEGACDVIVSDISLSDMDGIKFLIKVKEEYPESVRITVADKVDSQTLLKASSLSHQFLNKPYSAKHLRILIGRAFAVRDHLADCAIRQRLHDIGGVPTLPVLYQKVMDEILSDDPSVARVADIIEQDLGMSAKILQIVNSAGVGLASKVTSVRQAASLLGFDRIRALVLVSEMYAIVEDKRLPGGLTSDGLWRHSLKVGEYAKAIAESETDDETVIEESFMSGLLHDIGLIILAMSIPKELGAALAMAKEKKKPLFEAEKIIFGATHAQVGGYLLELWGLPDPIVVAITFHDFPTGVPEEGYPSGFPESGFTALTAVHVANYFCEDDEQAECGLTPVDVDATHLDALGCTEKMGDWFDQCYRAAN